MDALSLFGFVSSSCSIASFLISSDLRSTIENVRKFLSEVPAKYHRELTTPEGVDWIGLLVIDPDLLDDLVERVRTSEKEYRECIRSSSSAQERDSCDRRAQRNVCETLNRIRDRNQDVLPTDFLRKRWESYRCIAD